MKISGEQQFESWKLAARSNCGGSTNFCPIFTLTNSKIAGTSLSGLKHLYMSNF